MYDHSLHIPTVIAAASGYAQGGARHAVPQKSAGLVDLRTQGEARLYEAFPRKSRFQHGRRPPGPSIVKIPWAAPWAAPCMGGFAPPKGKVFRPWTIQVDVDRPDVDLLQSHSSQGHALSSSQFGESEVSPRQEGANLASPR